MLLYTTTIRNFIFSGVPSQIPLVWDFFFPTNKKKKKERKGQNPKIPMGYKRLQVTKRIFINKKIHQCQISWLQTYYTGILIKML